METLDLKTIISNIRPRFQERKSLALQVQNVKDYDRRKTQLKNIVEGIGPIIKQAELLRVNYEFQADIVYLDTIRANTNTMLKQFLLDPAEILVMGDSWFDLWKQVSRDLQKYVIQSWILYKTGNLFHIDEFEFSLLEMFEEYKPIQKELIALKSQLSAIMQEMPPIEQSEWDRIKALNEQIKQTWSKVSWAGLPKNIVSFISKAKAQGVAVSEYDNEIQTWLQKHGLEKYFVIKVGLRYV